MDNDNSSSEEELPQKPNYERRINIFEMNVENSVNDYTNKMR